MTRRTLCSWLFALCSLLFALLRLRLEARSIAPNSPRSANLPSSAFPPGPNRSSSNGAELIVSEKHDLPLVSFSITFLGGADQFETADKRGVASLTASMLSEGTKTRDGEALSNALQLLGTSVSVRYRKRERLHRLREHGRKVRRHAGHPGRHAPELDVSARGARTAPRAAARRAESGESPARRDFRTRVSASALRRCAPLWPGANGSLGESDHESRCRRVSPELFQAGTRAYHRRGRCHTSSGATGDRARSDRVVDAGGDRPSFTLPTLPAARPIDDLSRRQAWVRAVDVRDWHFQGHRETRPTTSRCR